MLIGDDNTGESDSVASVEMTGEETPKRPTVRIGRHFVREERFNSSGTTSVSIEYNLILSKFMRSYVLTPCEVHSTHQMC